VSVVCCQVEVSATSWSLVQRSLTDCGVSQMCVIMKPRRNEEAQAHIGLSSHRKKNVKRLSHLISWNRECVCTDHDGKLHSTKTKSSGMAYIVFTALHELLPYDASICICKSM
jgi:hypothetical protein